MSLKVEVWNVLFDAVFIDNYSLPILRTNSDEEIK